MVEIYRSECLEVTPVAGCAVLKRDSAKFTSFSILKKSVFGVVTANEAVTDGRITSEYARIKIAAI